jgi:toxin YoeB
MPGDCSAASARRTGQGDCARVDRAENQDPPIARQAVKIGFTADGWADYLYWLETDPEFVRRLNLLIKEATRTPFTGIGKPEPLRGSYAGCSRIRLAIDRVVEQSSGAHWQCFGGAGVLGEQAYGQESTTQGSSVAQGASGRVREG